MKIKVEGQVRQLVLNMAIAKYRLEQYLGESPGVTYTLASIHSHYAREYDVDLYYDPGELEKLTTDLWEAVK